LKSVQFYISSLLLISLLFSCEEPTEPDKNNPPVVPQIVVSGIVNQITQSGTEPADSCKIVLTTTDDTVITFTNNQGEFIDTIFTSESAFNLRTEKPGFHSIDTLIQNEDSQNLNLTINFIIEYVSYFPLKVDNKWKYYGEYYPGGDYVWYDYEGEEWWELTDLAHDSSWFKIITDFTGLKIKKQWGTPIDTTYLYNEIAELTLNNDDGILSLNSATGSGNSLLKWFFDTLNQTSIPKPQITHPINSGDTISVFIQDDLNFLKYDLIKNIGFDTLEVQYRPVDISIKHAYLGLLEYSIQK
jgi:hypothetical protein